MLLRPWVGGIVARRSREAPSVPGDAGRAGWHVGRFRCDGKATMEQVSPHAPGRDTRAGAESGRERSTRPTGPPAAHLPRSGNGTLAFYLQKLQNDMRALAGKGLRRAAATGWPAGAGRFCCLKGAKLL
jgi:hypothetical protein